MISKSLFFSVILLESQYPVWEISKDWEYFFSSTMVVPSGSFKKTIDLFKFPKYKPDSAFVWPIDRVYFPFTRVIILLVLV